MTTEEAEAYAASIDAIYLETSAKDNSNVEDLFVKLSTRLPPPPEQDSNIIRATAGLRKPQQSSSNCC